MDTLRHLLDLLGPHGSVAGDVERVVLRLVVAAILGGVIGAERETKHKPAGLRTLTLMCFGTAFFTILSEQLAHLWGGDHTRIAAQIIPGIGFIGAGSILRAGGSVTGLTTAATVFAVASIVMAVGGGFFLAAFSATVVLLLSLLLLGLLEGVLGLKASTITYEVTGERGDSVMSAINSALRKERHSMQNVQMKLADGSVRIQFAVEGSIKEHEALLMALQQSPALNTIRSLGPGEKE